MAHKRNEPEVIPAIAYDLISQVGFPIAYNDDFTLDLDNIGFVALIANVSEEAQVINQVQMEIPCKEWPPEIVAMVNKLHNYLIEVASEKGHIKPGESPEELIVLPVERIQGEANE